MVDERVVVVGDGQRRASWMVGMVVVEKQPLFVVDHTQIKHRQMPTFTLGMAWPHDNRY